MKKNQILKDYSKKVVTCRPQPFLERNKMYRNVETILALLKASLYAYNPDRPTLFGALISHIFGLRTDSYI